MLRLFYLLLLCLLPLFITAQNSHRVDSLQRDLEQLSEGDTLRISLLAKLWRAHKYNDLEKAETYARQMVREAEKQTAPKWRAAAYQCLASTLDYQGKPDSALPYYQQTATIYAKLEDRKQQGVTAFNTAGVFYYSLSQYDSTDYYLDQAESHFAVDSLLRQLAAVHTMRAGMDRFRGLNADALAGALTGLSLAEKSGDELAVADATHEVAMAYGIMGDNAEAIRYYKQNLAFDLRTNNDYNVATDLMTIASTFIDEKLLDSALVYAQRAEALVKEKDFVSLAANVQYNIAKIFQAKKEPERALQYFRRAESLNTDGRETEEFFFTLHQIGQTYLELKRPDLAKPYLERALASAKSRESMLQMETAYDQLSLAEGGLGNIRKEMEYLRKAHELKDDIYQKQAAEKLAELTALFEKEKRELTIQKQAAQLEAAENRERGDRLKKSLLGAGLLAAVALFGVIALVMRQRIIRQRAEQERLSAEVRAQSKQLSSHALQMAQKGQLLDQLGDELRQIKGERPDDRKKLNGMLRELSSEERIDQDWANFRTYFQGVHGDFEDRLKALAEAKPSPRELRLAALIKMQLNNQEVGSILGVSQDSLYKAKYRLRKKLRGASEGELDAFIQQI